MTPGAGAAQPDHQLRFEWGPNGLRALAPGTEVIVVVDVLRFTTAVSVAVAAGAVVLPYRWHDDGAATYAAEHDAVLAGRREDGGWSLSPTDLGSVPPGTRLVLPSPNGSALAFGAQQHAPDAVVFAGCLRNAAAVGASAAAGGGRLAVIGAGERWRGATGPLRPAVEDLLGAGAVLRGVLGATTPGGDAAALLSPEAAAAVAAFDAARHDLRGALAACVSGRELADRGDADDVVTAAALDADDVAPVLVDSAFVARTGR